MFFSDLKHLNTGVYIDIIRDFPSLLKSYNSV